MPVSRDRLERERILRGWSKEDFAEKAGINPNTLWKVYGSGTASVEIFSRICRTLEAHPPSEIAIRLMGEAAEGAA